MTGVVDTERPGHLDRGRGWSVVAAAFAANLVTFGTLFSFGVFLTPLAVSFDSTTGPVASIFSGSVCVYYLAGVVGGRLSDHHGARPVVAVGAVSLALGLFLTASTDEVWQAWLVYVPLVGVGVGCCYSPLIGAVGRWFERYRSLAIGLVLTGVACGTLVGPIVLRLLIEDLGWRVTFRWMSLVAIVVVGTAALVVASPPVHADSPSGSVTDIMRSPRFRTLYLSVIVISPGFYAPLVFFNDYAVARGAAGGAAAALVGISGAFSIVMRLVSGSLGDRVDAVRRYRVSYGLMTAALLVWWLAGGSYAMLVVSALLHGAGWAVWVTATPTVLAEWFGVGQLGGVLGLFYTGLGLGALVGPAASGFIIDRAGFRPAIGAALLTSLAATGITLLPLRERAVGKPAETATEVTPSTGPERG